MAGNFDNTDRGALFRNKKKQPGDKRPDYTGKINVGGADYFISGWLKQSQGGMSYMSLAVQTEEQAPRAAAPQKPAEPDHTPFKEDDIPF